MKTGLTPDKFNVIPFFDPAALTKPRSVGPCMFYVNGQWHSWLPHGDKLIPMKMTPLQASYFGDVPEKPSDWFSLLLHVVRQQISYPVMDRASAGLYNDFHNLATVLAKVDLFYEQSLVRKDVSRFVQTEIEYLVIVSRSVFDLLQEIVAEMWETTELHVKPKHEQSLPSSFNRVLYHENKEQSADQITAKYGIPLPMSEWYVSQRPFFSELRRLRDKMAHGGTEIADTIFCTERGFAIRRYDDPWFLFHTSPPHVELPNHLVPLRPVICSIVNKVFHACDSFAEMLLRTIQLPKPLFPGLLYFCRGFADRELVSIPDVIEKSLWCNEIHPRSEKPKPWYGRVGDWIAEEWRKSGP